MAFRYALECGFDGGEPPLAPQIKLCRLNSQPYWLRIIWDSGFLVPIFSIIEYEYPVPAYLSWRKLHAIVLPLAGPIAGSLLLVSLDSRKLHNFWPCGMFILQLFCVHTNCVTHATCNILSLKFGVIPSQARQRERLGSYVHVWGLALLVDRGVGGAILCVALVRW